MQDKVSISMSVSARLIAWAAWTLTVALLVAYVVTDDLRPGIVGLAMSAAAATLHIRCFVTKVDNNMKAVFELGRESAGGIHLVPYSTTPVRRD